MKWRVEKSGGADEGRQPLKYTHTHIYIYIIIILYKYIHYIDKHPQSHILACPYGGHGEQLGKSSVLLKVMTWWWPQPELPMDSSTESMFQFSTGVHQQQLAQAEFNLFHLRSGNQFQWLEIPSLTSMIFPANESPRSFVSACPEKPSGPRGGENPQAPTGSKSRCDQSPHCPCRRCDPTSAPRARWIPQHHQGTFERSLGPCTCRTNPWWETDQISWWLGNRSVGELGGSVKQSKKMAVWL